MLLKPSNLRKLEDCERREGPLEAKRFMYVNEWDQRGPDLADSQAEELGEPVVEVL